MDQALSGELGLLYLFEVLFLFLIIFLSFLNFCLGFGDLALCIELLSQLLINFTLNISKSLLGFGREVLHLFFAGGALRSLSGQRLKFLNLQLGSLHLREKLFGLALGFERLHFILTNTLFSLNSLVLDFANGHFLDWLLRWCCVRICLSHGGSFRLSLLLQQLLLFLLQFLHIVDLLC